MIDKIIPATAEHALMMAPNMRIIEVQEIAADSGLPPEAALLLELSRSISSWSWMVDGEVGCMFGVVVPALFDENSYPWFLTTPLVEHHAIAFARRCKTLLPELMAQHPHMVGMVDARHIMSVRWLKWLGASIEDPKPWGIAGLPFHRFTIGVKNATH